MDQKERKRFLIEEFQKIHGVEFVDNYIFELNGWEGLLVWAPSGWFYQFSYKNATNWVLSKFPDDIYGKRYYDDCDSKWYEKEEGGAI